MTSRWSVALAGSVVSCGVLGALVPACTGTPEGATTTTSMELGTATLQRHSGTRSTPITGLTPTAVELAPRADGVCLHVAAPIDATHVSLESGVQAASTGTRVSDVVPDAGEPIAIDARVAPAP